MCWTQCWSHHPVGTVSAKCTRCFGEFSGGHCTWGTGGPPLQSFSLFSVSHRFLHLFSSCCSPCHILLSSLFLAYQPQCVRLVSASRPLHILLPLLRCHFPDLCTATAFLPGKSQLRCRLLHVVTLTTLAKEGSQSLF